jgi:hypothetical protein
MRKPKAIILSVGSSATMARLPLGQQAVGKNSALESYLFAGTLGGELLALPQPGIPTCSLIIWGILWGSHGP